MHSFVKKFILPLILFCAFFALYIHNLSRAIYGGDVGDLVTAAALGGVAHPPGYPLFTFLGFILSRVFFFFQPAVSVGILSAFCGALGVLLFYVLTKKLTNSKLIALLSAAILGTNFLYWFYSEIAEVFALNALFAIALFCLAIYLRSAKRISLFLLFFFILGLSFTNHQTIIFLVPSLFILIGKPLFLLIRKNPFSPLWLFFAFAIGLSPFAYIFIAASKHPIINWDYVHDVSSFLHLVLRQDYGTLKAGIFESPSWMQRLVTLRLYAQYFFLQLTLPVVFIIAIGLFYFVKKEKLLFIAIILAWVLSGPFFVTYAGFPLTGEFIIGAYERFVLLSLVIFLIPFGNGLLKLSHSLAHYLPKRRYDLVFQGVFFFIPFMLFIYNFPKTNLSTVRLAQTYAEDYLQSLPKNAVLFISGDTEIFNTWYVHYVLNYRPDVLLYNIGATPVEANSISEALKGIPLKKRSSALTIAAQHIEKSRPVFSTTRFPSKTKEAITWVPYGLSFRMYQSEDTLPTEEEYISVTDKIWQTLRMPTSNVLENPAVHNLTIIGIPTNYSNSLLATGTFFFSQYKDVSKALFYYQKAIAEAPDNDKSYAALGILYTTIPNSCEKSAEYLSTSIDLNPYQDLSYFILYNTYKSCLKDSKKADKIKEDYEVIFQKNFDMEAKKSLTSITNILPIQ